MTHPRVAAYWHRTFNAGFLAMHPKARPSQPDPEPTYKASINMPGSGRSDLDQEMTFLGVHVLILTCVGLADLVLRLHARQHPVALRPQPLSSFVVTGVCLDAAEAGEWAGGVGRDCNVAVFTVDARPARQRRTGRSP